MSSLATDYVSATEASHVLKVSSTYVRRLVELGRLTGVHTPVGYLIDRMDLDRLARERSERPGRRRGRGVRAA